MIWQPEKKIMQTYVIFFTDLFLWNWSFVFIFTVKCILVQTNLVNCILRRCLLQSPVRTRKRVQLSRPIGHYFCGVLREWHPVLSIKREDRTAWNRKRRQEKKCKTVHSLKNCFWNQNLLGFLGVFLCFFLFCRQKSCVSCQKQSR